jgi:regulator of nucleoside diphosphate kinase
MSNFNSIPVITDLDAVRIRELGNRLHDGPGLEAFNELISKVQNEAEIVPSRKVGPDVVTVNSVVTFRDELLGSEHRVTLVYPAEMSISQRRISVLSPVGRALLGQAVGSVASLELPDGTMREIRVLELHYQPEASGEFTR